MITSTDGTPLAVRHTGQGTPIVLVHGSLGNIDSFVSVEPSFAERHQVWVYSWRAHAGSGDGKHLDIGRQAEDLLAVIQAAGDDVHLCGWSTGALYAIEAARHATALRSLILYEPPVKLDAELAARMYAEVAGALDEDSPSLALERFFPYAGVTASEAALLRSKTEVWESLCDGVRILPRELEAMDRQHAAPINELPHNVATLYLYGEHTRSPSFLTVAEVGAVVPHAEIRALLGQRHLAPVLDPMRFASSILEFTTALDRARS